MAAYMRSSFRLQMIGAARPASIVRHVVRPIQAARDDLTLIRHCKGLAPAVVTDLALDDLAGGRRLEQRAGAAAINTVRLVLIFGLSLGHLLGGPRRRQPKAKHSRDARDHRANELSSRPSPLAHDPSLVPACSCPPAFGDLR